MKIILTKPENAQQLLDAIIKKPEQLHQSLREYPKLFKECIHLRHAYIRSNVDASFELVDTFCEHADEILACEKTLKSIKIESKLSSIKIKRYSNSPEFATATALAKRTLENLVKEKGKLDAQIAKITARCDLLLMPLQSLFS